MGLRSKQAASEAVERVTVLSSPAVATRLLAPSATLWMPPFAVVCTAREK